MLSQFRFALEQALAKANFLNTSDVVVLQAFVLFLTLVRREDDTRFCWTLTGLAIRIAQGLGIHRDGTNFDLSPFDTEIRRRLWWALCALDLRSAEELGTDLTITDRSFDTQLPSNINDSEIDPDTVKLPPPRDGRSDCAVALVRYEICALSRRLHTISTAMAPISPDDAAATLAERERMLIEVYDKVENKFLKRPLVADDDSLFWMAALVARVIVAKMGLVIYQPMLFSTNKDDVSTEIRDRVFISAIEIVEYNHILNTDEKCKQWRWLFQTYRQWHAIAYVVMEIARRSWTATSERAWEAVNATLSQERNRLEMVKMADHVAVWLPLRRLFLKSKKHRESEIARLRADPEGAHQLDVDDRLNPLPARLGPVPGLEHNLGEIRTRWRKMVMPEGYNPGQPQRPLPQTSATSATTTTPKPRMPGNAQGPSRQVPLMDGVNTITRDGVVSDANMQLMTEVMSHPTFNPAELWSIAMPGNSTTAVGNEMAMGSSFNSHLGTSVSHNLRQDNPRRHEQPVSSESTGQPPSVLRPGHTPPWLWSDAFPTVNDDRLGNVQIDDVDMNMDMDEFNWQNWQESIKGLEMQSSSTDIPSRSAW
jgi:hypothetical protein